MNQRRVEVARRMLRDDAREIEQVTSLVHAGVISAEDARQILRLAPPDDYVSPSEAPANA